MSRSLIPVVLSGVKGAISVPPENPSLKESGTVTPGTGRLQLLTSSFTSDDVHIPEITEVKVYKIRTTLKGDYRVCFKDVNLLYKFYFEL